MLNDKGGICQRVHHHAPGRRQVLPRCRRPPLSGTISTGRGSTYAEGAARIRIDNLSARYGSIIVAGPKSREMLAQGHRGGSLQQGLPWLSARQIEIGYARMLAMRVNYVGELGWELHVPMEQMVPIA